MTRWTPERDEHMRTLAANGLTAERIAEALGRDFTRNMVIGRAGRIGINLGVGRGPSRKPRPYAQRSKPRPRRMPQEPVQRQKPSLAATVAREPVPAAPEPLVAVSAYVEPGSTPPADSRVTIDDLRMPVSQCRWIDGEVDGAATLYCGAGTKPGKSYCGEHHARVWAPYRRSKAA